MDVARAGELDWGLLMEELSLEEPPESWTLAPAVSTLLAEKQMCFTGIRSDAFQLQVGLVANTTHKSSLLDLSIACFVPSTIVNPGGL